MLLLLSCSRQPNRVRPSVTSGQKGQKNWRVKRARGAKGEFEASRIGREGEGQDADQETVVWNQVRDRVVEGGDAGGHEKPSGAAPGRW